MLSPITGKLAVLGILGLLWMVAGRNAMRLDGQLPFQVAAFRRDERKARFYFLSLSVGLLAGLLSFLCLEVVDGIFFFDITQKLWMQNLLRGVGMFGLGVSSIVWLQVGQRASQINSDGASLLPVPDEKKNKK